MADTTEILGWYGDEIRRDGEGVARIWGGNVFSESNQPEWADGVWVTRPGWVEAEDGEPTSPVDPTVSFRTFAAAGRAELDAAVVRLGGLAGGSGGRVVFWPSAASAMSDIPSVRAVANGWGADDPFGLLVDPGALLIPAMLREADEHLRRMAEELVPLGRVWAVRITDVVEDGEGLRAVPVGEGRLPLDAMCSVAAAARAADRPVVLLAEGGIDEQARRLGLA
ncbi:MAG: hypothetical protein AAF297_07275 [Planctomycetota bacterium]